jgi:hypothetical protein
MTDARLQAELADSKAEIQRLRECTSMGTPAVHKDLSLISLIPKWSGLESGVPLEEFLKNIDGSAQIGRWSEADKLRIAALKLTESARMFCSGCPE